MLDGVNREANFSTTYFERQPYLPGNPTEIPLSRVLTIADIDVDVQMLVEANVTITDGKSFLGKQ